jgi:hypothetical protein
VYAWPFNGYLISNGMRGSPTCLYQGVSSGRLPPGFVVLKGDWCVVFILSYPFSRKEARIIASPINSFPEQLDSISFWKPKWNAWGPGALVWLG